METMMSLLGSPEFSAVVRRAWEGPLLRQEFDTMPLPEGVDPDDVWQALKAIRRAQGFYSPEALRTIHGAKNNWYTIPESLHTSLRNIAALTRKGSELDRIAQERKGRRFITQTYVEEILTSLTYDGYSTNYEILRSVLLEERKPQKAAEIIAANFHHIMQNLEDFSARPFTTQILQDLYGELISGVDSKDMLIGQPLAARGTPRSPLESHYIAVNTEDETTTDLASVAIIAQQKESMTPSLDPIMVSMLVNCQFWRTLVVPGCNNLMGCVASRLYLCQQGFPVLRYMPKMLILEKWRRGYYDNYAEATYTQVMERVDDDMDWTLYYDTFMKLLLHEIEATQEALTQRKTADDRAISGIRMIPYLSHRQQDILRQAVLSPDYVFTISAHQKRYRTAYSTARADLEKLADAGYLLRRMKGAAYTYVAAPDLQRLLTREQLPTLA